MSKFYEVTEPYYALIKAEDEKEMKHFYQDGIAIIGDDFKFKEIEFNKALEEVTDSFINYVALCDEIGESHAPIGEYLGENILLIDGSLI